MNGGAVDIPVFNLALAFIPSFAALAICYRWSRLLPRASWSVARMLAQLIAIGYVLTFLFESRSPWLVGGVLVMMVTVSSWIAIGSMQSGGVRWFLYALVSIAIAGTLVLVLVTQLVLEIDPWYDPRFTIPLAGMIYANSMNTVSLAAERLEAELARGDDYELARAAAFNAALIPQINALLAVGLVSLPGMMTGQILSGVSPLIAVRYQIVVMSMIFGCSTLAMAVFLHLSRRERERLANVR